MSITNSGSVYGTYTGQALYLQEMVSWYSARLNRTLNVTVDEFNGFGSSTSSYTLHRPDVNKCIDQGLQSYLTFTGAFHRLFLDAYRDGRVHGGVGYLFDETGPVHSMNLGRPWVCGRYDSAGTLIGIENGMIMNAFGGVSAVVHQFDRWCNATLHNTWLLGSQTASSAALHRATVLAAQMSENGSVIDRGTVLPMKC